MNFGFVSTRFAGTDGVSLESRKWAEVLGRSGHRCFWFAGRCAHPAEISHVVPEAHFAHPEIGAIHESIWGRDALPDGIAASVERHRAHLRAELDAFVRRFGIDVIVSQNASAIPMNIPLGVALADLLRETGLPALAHHHDFHWERERFSGAAARAWLDEAFPPRLPGVAHAVIHSDSAREMRQRFGIAATLVPNVMDFEAPPPASDVEALRAALGFSEDDRVLLQPTRVVPRKGIEHAVELVHRLGDPRNRLVVSHEAGDEGLAYRDWLLALAREKSVDLRFVDPALPGAPALPEFYALADFVTFPSLYEGFGNALLEAVYFKKPVLVNRYPVFREDIEPCGFEFVTMDGRVTDGVVSAVRRQLENPSSVRPAADRNFEIAAERFGYATLSERLDGMLRGLGKR